MKTYGGCITDRVGALLSELHATTTSDLNSCLALDSCLDFWLQHLWNTCHLFAL